MVVADHQTAGRGRLGRRWEAPAGANLLVSVLLRPDLAADELHLCTVAVALAAAVGLRRRPPASSADAQVAERPACVGERKLAGILAEAAPGAARTGRTGAWWSASGCNVAWPPPDGEPGPSASACRRGLAAGHARLLAASRRDAGSRPAALLEPLLAELWTGAWSTLADGRRPAAAGLGVPASVCATLGRRVTRRRCRRDGHRVGDRHHRRGPSPASTSGSASRRDVSRAGDVRPPRAEAPVDRLGSRPVYDDAP